MGVPSRQKTRLTVRAVATPSEPDTSKNAAAVASFTRFIAKAIALQIVADLAKKS